MDENSSDLSGLWADLGSEAETLPQGERPAPPRTPFKRRISLTDKAVAVFLSGGLPVYFFLCLGTLICLPALTRSEAFSRTVLDGLAVAPPLAMLFLLPVAWLASGLLRADKATGPRLVTVALLAGGLGQIVTAVPLFLFSLVLNRQPDFWGLARSLPPLLESYFSFSTWSLTAAAACLVMFILKRLRRSHPWVETSHCSSSWRLAVAALLLSIPWLLLAGFMVAEGRVAPETMTWLARAEIPPAPSLEGVRQYPPVARLARNVSRTTIKSGANVELHDKWVVKDVRSTEAEMRTLLAKLDQRLEGDALYELLNIMRALEEQAEQLRDPMGLGWQIIDTAIEQRPGYHDLVTQAALSQLLLPNLCQDDLSVEQLTAQLEALDRLEAGMLEPKRELDAMLLYACRQSAQLPADRKPFHAFGIDLRFSAEGVLTEIRLASRLSLWMAIREHIRWESSEALHDSVGDQIRARLPLPTTAGEHRRTPEERVITDAVERCFTLKLQPYLQTIRAVIVLRLYKAANGHYPQSLQTVAAQLGGTDPSSFTYKLRGEQAVISRAGVTNLKTRSQSWTLS